MSIQEKQPPTSLKASTEAEFEAKKFTPTFGLWPKILKIKSCHIGMQLCFPKWKFCQLSKEVHWVIVALLCEKPQLYL